MLEPGSKVGHIRVEASLGRGGMGEVYAGYDETLQRKVVLKTIRSEHRLTPSTQARFLREARILSQLDHPHICRIFDYIQGHRNDYLVLEFVEGLRLGERIHDRDLDWNAKLRIARQIAEVLAAAHSEGVVHRDIKPDNVMVGPDSQIKVLDFGLAASPAEPVTASSKRLPVEADAQLTLGTDAQENQETMGLEDALLTDFQTRHGSLLGTPLFMSPEQARGEPAETASDMYSFGLLLQELFTNRPPYEPSLTTERVLALARKGESLDAEAGDRDLDELIRRLKSLAPAARPTAVEAAQRLKWIADRPKRRLRWLIAAAVLLVVLVAGLKYTLDLRDARDEAERRRAQAEDLISFMLGDLRTKLESVGRLDVLNDAGKKALEYFESLPQQDLTSDQLHRLSKALHQIGEVRAAQGDLQSAMATLQESLALAQRVAAENPQEDRYQAGLGYSHFWIGYVHWLQGSLEEALRHFRAYLEISEILAQRQPDSPEWRLELAYAHSNIGSVLDRQGRAAEALKEFQSVVDIRRPLLDEEPSNIRLKRDFADSLSWLAGALEGEGQLLEARKVYLEAHQILNEAAQKEPGNPRNRYLLSINHNKLGRIQEFLGQRQEALRHFHEEVQISGGLIVQDPENGDWRQEHAVALRNRGRALLAAGSLKEAMRDLYASQTSLKELLEKDPTNQDKLLHLALSEIALVQGWEASGRLSAALQLMDSVLLRLEEPGPRRDRPSAAPGKEESARLRRVLAEAFLVKGEVLARLQGRPAAGPWFERARRTIEPLAQNSDNSRDLELLARALIRLDRHEEAAPLLKKLAGQGYSVATQLTAPGADSLR